MPELEGSSWDIRVVNSSEKIMYTSAIIDILINSSTSTEALVWNVPSTVDFESKSKGNVRCVQSLAHSRNEKPFLLGNEIFLDNVITKEIASTGNSLGI